MHVVGVGRYEYVSTVVDAAVGTCEVDVRTRKKVPCKRGFMPTRYSPHS
jgi:hypothetical protein